MSRLKQTLRHLRRVWSHRNEYRGNLELPVPLELVVQSCNRSSAFIKFFDTLLANTQWPLNIIVCDCGSTEQSLLDYLDKIKDKTFGKHTVSVIRDTEATHPRGFNEGLKQTRNHIVAIADGDVVIPNLGQTCWATMLLKAMQAYPHVGWLSSRLCEGHEEFNFPQRSSVDQELIKPLKTVKGTRGEVLDLPCETQLGILRRDIFTDYKAPELHFDQFYRDKINPLYAVGQLRGLKLEHCGWLYHDKNESGLTRGAFSAYNVKRDYPSDIPFHIITLTHNRPFWFGRCRQSIERQTAFSNVKHIVTVDDPKDLDYVPANATVIRVEPKRDVYCYYQTYINHALAACDNKGLVMILDDDDSLLNCKFVETCLRAYNELDALFFRAQLKETSRVPKKIPFSFPLYGDIASCGWVLKTEIAKKEQFFAGHGQDHNYINRVFRFHLLNQKGVLWSRDVLTSTQAGRSFSKTQTPSNEPLRFNDNTIELFA